MLILSNTITSDECDSSFIPGDRLSTGQVLIAHCVTPSVVLEKWKTPLRSEQSLFFFFFFTPSHIVVLFSIKARPAAHVGASNSCISAAASEKLLINKIDGIKWRRAQHRLLTEQIQIGSRSSLCRNGVSENCNTNAGVPPPTKYV